MIPSSSLFSIKQLLIYTSLHEGGVFFPFIVRHLLNSPTYIMKKMLYNKKDKKKLDSKKKLYCRRRKHEKSFV